MLEPQLFRPPTRGRVHDTERLLSGEIPFHGRWAQWHPGAGFWHTDPISGAKWPPLKPGQRINYRPGNGIGDVRVLWELNRLQHLFLLARIAADEPSLREKALVILSQHLFSWKSANPARRGANSISALEQAMRLIALLHTYDLVRNWVTPEFRQAILDISLEHAMSIEQGLSLYSSAGNHTIGEAVGLLYAGTLLGECSRAKHWRELARGLLEHETRRQILPDGGGQEQSSWYLLYVIDLLSLAQLLLAHRDQPAIPEVETAMPAGRAFLSALGASPAEIPRIGDADDGFALCPDLDVAWIPRTKAGYQEFSWSGVTTHT
ncbi:MAG: heparinase II/III family protein, partial [Gammaproteobacteria bacterium]|nr:heparinase II/III family protein [Gammaproteobacteria bacterium]